MQKNLDLVLWVYNLIVNIKSSDEGIGLVIRSATCQILFGKVLNPTSPPDAERKDRYVLVMRKKSFLNYEEFLFLKTI